jgi:acetyl esterase/lipase
MTQALPPEAAGMVFRLHDRRDYMSREQAAAIAQSLRDSPFDPGGDAVEQRVLFARLMATRPSPAGVVTSELRLGGTPAIGISVGDPRPDGPAVLYFHGGGYAVGTAVQTIGLPAEIARRGNYMVLSVDYRLAPEDPFPAAVDDGLDAYKGALGAYPVTRLAVAGESAGGGLALATLLAAGQRGLPMPAAVLVMSPWVDLTLSGPSLTTKASVDPVMTLQALERRAEEYAGNEPRTNPLVSPLWGDFGGFPPLLIQVGSHEILLDDAVRLAGRAAASDVPVVLEVTPYVHHVFQAVAAQLDEGDAALRRASAFLSQHLSGPGPAQSP